MNRRLIAFGFGTGLRTSELIALRWEDLDAEREIVRIRRARVRGQIKEPKTRAGIRDVELSRDALGALREQWKKSNNSEEIFHDPKTGNPWKSDQPLRKRVWIPALKRAGVEYREQYQMRHTYASNQLTSGANPLWVAKQLGHSDWGMIRKVYGRWMSDE